MTSEKLRNGPEERPQPPSEILDLASGSQEDVWVYNPREGNDLLVYNCHGLAGGPGGEPVRQNISPRKPIFGIFGRAKGWELERKNIRSQEDNSTHSAVVVRHEPSDYSFALFNNVWKFGEEGIEELLKGKSYTFITENGDLVFIPVRSKRKGGGGVMITTVKDLNEPKTLELITNFLKSKAIS